jgi:hypothetical protein
MTRICRIGVTLLVAGGLLSAPIGAYGSSTTALRHVAKPVVTKTAPHHVRAGRMTPADEPYCC